MESTSKGPSCGLGSQVGRQRGDGLGVVTGVVGKLDRDRLSRALGDGAVELLDRPLGLDALVEADKADTL